MHISLAHPGVNTTSYTKLRRVPWDKDEAPRRWDEIEDELRTKVYYGDHEDNDGGSETMAKETDDKVAEAIKGLQDSLSTALKPFHGVQQPVQQPVQPAQPQPHGLTEETGRKICHGLECFNKTGEMFKAAAENVAKGMSAQKAAAQMQTNQAPADATPRDATPRPNYNHAHASLHTQGDVEKVEQAIDSFVRCKDGICRRTLARKVLYHFDTLFPGMTIRSEKETEVEAVERIVAERLKEGMAENEKEADAEPQEPEPPAAEPEKKAETKKPAKDDEEVATDEADDDAAEEDVDDEEETDDDVVDDDWLF